jgi:hypothetical protein
VDEWAELEHALADMAAAGSAEVREDGEWLAELAELRCELSRQGKQPLMHLWSDERNLTRRVVRVRDLSAERIVLDVQRFGRAKPGRLEFLRTEGPRAAARVTREQFRSRFRRILSERFPDSTIEGMTSSPDLEHSFSGLYVRGRMSEGPRTWAVMGVSAAENSAAVEGMLAFGILWLHWTRDHADRRAIEGLRLFVPEGRSRALRERMLGLSASAKTDIYEFRDVDGQVEQMDPADAGNLESWLMSRREVESTLVRAREGVARLRALAGNDEAIADAIAARVSVEPNEVELSFRGLDFARWVGGELFFGLGDADERLTETTQKKFGRLLHDLGLHRSALAEQTSHSLYRAAPERWLETLVLEDSTRLEASLDPQHLYSQVPALRAGDRGVLDLLGVTRRGRLVVMELKTSEDIQLPLQAVDYWLRVRRHQRERDFERQGYFPGIVLDEKPPLLWLVAPSLRFHSSTETILKYLDPGIQVTRIGVNENWRRGIKVVLRQ